MAEDKKSKKRMTKEEMEEIQQEILETELETKRLGLAKAQRDNAEYVANEEQRHRKNRQRMAELKTGRETKWAIIQGCRHKAGGTPKNIQRGGGIGSFSVLSKAVMPDGVTALYQCPRCRLMMYTPSKKQRQLWFQTYEAEMAYYSKIKEQCEEEGIQDNETRGPTFLFQKDGVPIVPERV